MSTVMHKRPASFGTFTNVNNSEGCRYPRCTANVNTGVFCTSHQERQCCAQNCFLPAGTLSLYCSTHQEQSAVSCGDTDCDQMVSPDESSKQLFAHKGSNRKRRLSGSKIADTENRASVVNANIGWTYPENVFLAGVVFEYFLANGDGGSNWSDIKKNYEVAWNRYITLNPTLQHSKASVFSRSCAQLESHYRLTLTQGSAAGVLSFAHLICDWELKYNVNGCLIDKPPRAVTEKACLAFYQKQSLWTMVDDIFLVAAIVDNFLKSGNLGMDAVSWCVIKSTFDSYQWANASSINPGYRFMTRQVTAMFARFKDIKDNGLVGFLYAQWRATFQGLIFVTLLQMQATDFNSKINAMMTGVPTQLNNTVVPAQVQGHVGPAINGSNNNDSNLLNLLKAARAEEVAEKKSRKKKARKNRGPSDDVLEPSESMEGGKEKRNRWKEEDEVLLWKGIAAHGNSWSAIAHAYLPMRTHHQVKDKGKRLLRGEGWITGRSRESSIQACQWAKQIATRKLDDVQDGKTQRTNAKVNATVPKVYPVVTPMKLFPVSKPDTEA